MKVRTSSAEETRTLGAALAPILAGGDVVALSGELGSGKTVLAQGIARGLGVEQPVTSPTFVIVREYEGPVPFAHVDVYRLDHLQELHDLGFEEVIDDRRVVVIEWADRVEAFLPDDRMDVRLSTTDEDVREIDIVPRGLLEHRSTAVEAALAGFEALPC